jgi:hypothetical protein
MWDWLAAVHATHIALVLLTAVGVIHFWARTRFWLPSYVHYLAGLGLAVGLACLAFMPTDAPIHRSGWGGVKKALLVLAMPALVYVVFIPEHYARARRFIVGSLARSSRICPRTRLTVFWAERYQNRTAGRLLSGEPRPFAPR